MPEDSGAFKTNPAKSGQIPAFVMTREHRCHQVSGVQKTLCHNWAAVTAFGILTTAGNPLRYP
jgi:hypothetical protein